MKLVRTKTVAKLDTSKHHSYRTKGLTKRRMANIYYYWQPTFIVRIDYATNKNQ